MPSLGAESARRLRLLLVFGCGLAAATVAAEPAREASDERNKMSTTKVAELALSGRGVTEAKAIRDFIWMSPGVTGAFLVTTSEGDVVVNTGLAREAEEHRSRFAAKSDAPVRVIVFTQSHADRNCSSVLHS